MGIRGRLSLFCTMIFLISSTVGIFGVSFFVPSNSDFVIFASGFTDLLDSNSDLTLGSMMIFGKDSTGPLIFNNLYTIMSGDVENLGDVGLDLSNLPIGVIFDEGTSEDSIIELLSYLSYSTPEIVDLSESEKEIIAGANEFFIVKSGKRYYLCFSDVSRRFVKDMFSGKLSKTAIEIPDDFVFYYKSLKGAPLGEMLYSFGDFYGKPVSEELSARMIDGKLTFDLTIKKETTEYEKSLIKESEVSAIDDLDVIKDADMIINGVGELGYAFAYGLLNLSGVELKRNYFESFIFSSSSKHDTVLFSAKYNSDYDKETLDRMASELSYYFSSVVMQEERQVVNAFSGSGMYLEKINEEAQNKIFYLMLSQELLGFPVQIDLTRMDDGGLKLSGSIDNITMIPSLLESFFLSNNTNYDETTIDEYEYNEYGTSDETTTDEYGYDEYEYDEYGTTDETMTDEYSYEDETEDAIIESLLYLIDDCYSSLFSAYGPLTKEDLQGWYDDWFLDRISVTSVDTGDGYKEYVMIVYSTTDLEDLEYIAESVSDQSWAAYMVDGNNIVFVVTIDYNNAAQ